MLTRDGIRLKALLVGLATATALLFGAGSAMAKTYFPTSVNDPIPDGCRPNNCSLREAVIAANSTPGKDTIVLEAGRRYELNITGIGEDAAATGDLDVSAPVTVQAPKFVSTSKGRKRARPATIDGNHHDRIFDLASRLTLNRLTLQGGATSAGENGGAVNVDSSAGILRAFNSRLLRNDSDNHGGAVAIESGAHSHLFKNVRIAENQANSDSGAVDISPDPGAKVDFVDSRITDNESGGNGGGSYTDEAAVSFVRSTLSGNSSVNGGGALYRSGGTVTVNRSTIAGNTTPASGGGIWAHNATTVVLNSTISGNSAGVGGGIRVNSNLTVTDSTIADNRATGSGGGIVAGGASSAASLNGVTIANNLADSDNAGGGLGGGLYQAAGDTISSKNSIVGLNQVGTPMATGQDCYNEAADFDSQGHNLIGDIGGCTGFDATGDLVGGNLNLGNLAKNGGPTKTIALLGGSRAINRAGGDAPAKDQRGVKRGGKPDIGAYELVKK
ncbi:MAG: hypothetical protein EXQ70_01645 [Solirubrobacterales bacterium]|nr:hypothetical protein [Solirubrobacterales bacterium]